MYPSLAISSLSPAEMLPLLVLLNHYSKWTGMKVVTGVLTRECHVLLGIGSNVNFAHLAHSEQRILATCQVKVELSVLRKELKELFDGLRLPVSTSIVYVCIHLFISTVVLACVAICCCSIDGLSYAHVMYHIGCK